MEKKLKKLFDYQKFEQNEKLNKLISEAHYSASFIKLSDEDLKQVAGGKGGAAVNPQIREKR